VQQRITTHILHYALSSDEDLKSVLVSDYVYATSSPATCTLSVSPARSRETIELFRSGQVQVLFATSVAEEGEASPSYISIIMPIYHHTSLLSYISIIIHLYHHASLSSYISIIIHLYHHTSLSSYISIMPLLQG